VIGDLEGRLQQLTLEAESRGDVTRQLELGNSQMQMNVDELHAQLVDAEARFVNIFFTALQKTALVKS